MFAAGPDTKTFEVMLKKDDRGRSHFYFIIIFHYTMQAWLFAYDRYSNWNKTNLFFLKATIIVPSGGSGICERGFQKFLATSTFMGVPLHPWIHFSCPNSK